MKRKITFLSAAFMLLAFLAIPLGMRGQAPVNTVLWGEDFSGFGNNADPSGDYTTNSHDGTTVYGGVTITYSKANGGGTTQTYTSGGPNSNNNLLIAKNNGAFTISGISTGEAAELTVSYAKSGSGVIAISTSNDVTIDGSASGSTITTNGASTIDITFTNTASSNLRIDDISIIVKTAGGTPAVTHTLTFSANPTDGGTVTVGNNTLAEGATTSISATANTGYVFGSWTVSGEGSSVNEAGDTFTMGTEDATLTANFTQVTTYTVTYHANVTGIEDVVDTYNAGATVTLRPANTFTNEGYTFSGWNTQAEGDGDAYEAGYEIENIQENLVLFAIWTENTTPGGENLELSFSMTSNPGGWPTANSSTLTEYTYTLGGVDYTFALKNVKCNSGYLMMTQVAVLGLPAIDGYKLTKVVASNSSGCSTSTKVGISSSATSGEYIDGGDIQTWSTTSSTYTYNLTSTASNTMYYMYVTNKNAQVINLALTYEAVGGTPAPSITAENVSIAYDATSGSIVYEINNGVDGGTLTAATESWLTLGQVGETVPFTCTANEAAAPRTATVTLTYTYNNDETVTKNVTVTQSGNPDVTPTIAEVRAQGTGNVVTKGIVTSCVGTTGYIQDATAAICVYGTSLTVGDEIRVSGSLTTYKGLLEIANPQVTVLSSGNTVNPQLMTVAEVVASENQGWYIRIEEATVTNINNKNVTIAQGDNSILVYFNSTDDITFEADDVISLNGNIGCYNTTQIANPQNVEVQAAPAEPSITINPDTYEIATEGGEGTITVTYDGVGDTYPEVAFYDENGEPVDYAEYYESWITVNVNTYDNDNVLYVCEANTGEARTVYFKVYVDNVYSNMVTISQAEYVAPVVPATITVDPDEVSVDAEEHDGTLALTYENLTISDMEDFDVQFYDAQGEETDEPDWIEVLVAEQNPNEGDGYVVSYYMVENDGEARTAYFKVFAMNGDDFVYSNLVTITQTAAETPVGEEAWVLTNLADLTANDVFVIVGTTSDGALYAMSNDNGTTTAPAAVGVTVVDDMLENAPEANIQWNLSIADNGYTFYPNGNTESWLYCTTTSGSGNNNNMRVGDGSRNVFTFNNDGYMITNDDYATRYMSVYNNQEWRGYVNTNNNPVAISFYKKVGDEPQPVVASITVNPATVEALAEGEDGTLTVTYENITNIYAAVYFYDAEGNETTYDWITAEIDAENNVYYMIGANEGEARTAYLQVWAFDDNYEYVASNMVTVNQVAGTTPAIEGWVLTDLADLTEGDVFVIVGTTAQNTTYALPNNGGTNNAPTVIAIEVEDDALTTEPEDELKWNLSRQGNSYTFYPNGDAANWLYCNTTASSGNNNNMRVGTGLRNQFTLDYNNYLVTNDGYNTRYLSIYGTQDWRGYNNDNSAVAISFYKKVVEPETYTLAITGYGDSEGGYRLIASPVYVNPETTGMITDDGTNSENYTYDFYFFDQAQEDEWRNYRQEAFNLIPGKGYLYANSTDVELTFMGIPYDGDGEIALSYTEGAQWAGWNLVGNPFGVAAEISEDFYTMNPDGDEIIPGENYIVDPMQGVFVVAENAESTVLFAEAETVNPATEAVVVNVMKNRGNVIDRAIVRFGEGRQLPKFQLNPNSTKVYIPQGAEDFAVVRSANQGEMPVNFKAKENGNYTISVNTGDLEVEYLHLIDNMTGADVDLLRTPSYTFDANTTDFASRFRLVFSANGVDDNTESSNASFAFYNGSEWVISNTGAATLQVVDVMGRVLSTESINGNATANVNQVAGIYMLRLVNGDNVRVQKIVVK